MSYWSSEEMTALRATTREFVKREVLPHQDEWEREGELPRSLHVKAGELGLIGVGFPEHAGGGGGGERAAITVAAVSYTHLTLPTKPMMCRSRWSPYH